MENIWEGPIKPAPVRFLFKSMLSYHAKVSFSPTPSSYVCFCKQHHRISPPWLSPRRTVLGFSRLKMHGQMGKETQARGIHTLAAAGSHLLFVNSDMWAPAVSFKLGESCATKLNAQKATLSCYPEAQSRLLHRPRQGVARGDTARGSREAQPKGPLVSLPPSSFLQPPSGARRELCSRWVLAVALTSLEWIKP